MNPQLICFLILFRRNLVWRYSETTDGSLTTILDEHYFNWACRYWNPILKPFSRPFRMYYMNYWSGCVASDCLHTLNLIGDSMCCNFLGIILHVASAGLAVCPTHLMVCTNWKNTVGIAGLLEPTACCWQGVHRGLLVVTASLFGASACPLLRWWWSQGTTKRQQWSWLQWRCRTTSTSKKSGGPNSNGSVHWL